MTGPRSRQVRRASQTALYEFILRDAVSWLHTSPAGAGSVCFGLPGYTHSTLCLPHKKPGPKFTLHPPDCHHCTAFSIRISHLSPSHSPVSKTFSLCSGTHSPSSAKSPVFHLFYWTSHEPAYPNSMVLKHFGLRILLKITGDPKSFCLCGLSLSILSRFETKHKS